ncbi:MAG TPA: TlpA disulfide reductase family protein [Parafilimonas sp.]|nr:TlpA disulfide reductase family protein [Parafilimonas sp.]
MKLIFSITFFLFLFTNSFGQNKIYFFNQTGRPVWIQKRTILEIGSFPYVLDTSKYTLQNIPIDTKDAAILNVVVVPSKGVYGTADGIYYLFKENDTVIIKLSKENQPLITHISSATRTKELAFPLKLVDRLKISPFYVLERKNLALLQLIYSSEISLEKRDHLIDSITRPYINTAKEFCINNNINTEIGELYQHQFEGMLIYYKLGAYNDKYKYKNEINNFYKDSLIKWSDGLECENCSNIPFYNLAMHLIYTLRFKNLDANKFLDTVSSTTHGYLKNFILSRYVNDKIEETKTPEALLNSYDSLCNENAYKEIVHNNYILHNSFSKNDSDLAVLLNSDKVKTGFNQLISRFKGKVIYIDFWASWCKPCIEEIPFSHKLFEKIADKNIVMLYVSIDTDFDSWKQASERFGISNEHSYVLANYGQDKLSKKFNLNTVPIYFIIDKTGRIINADASRPSEQDTYNQLMKFANE